jgi:hypothetical protein
MKKLAALLLAGFLTSCLVPKQKEEFLQVQQLSSLSQLILIGFYDRGLVFISDTDNDNKLDKKFYYEMIGSTKPDSNSSDLANLFILKYEKSEPYQEDLEENKSLPPRLYREKIPFGLCSADINDF